MRDELTRELTEKLKRGEKLEVGGVVLEDKSGFLQPSIYLPDPNLPPLTLPIEVDVVKALKPRYVQVKPSRKNPALIHILYSGPAVCWIDEVSWFDEHFRIVPGKVLQLRKLEDAV